MVTHTVTSERSLTKRDDIRVEEIPVAQAKELIMKNHYTTSGPLPSSH